MPPRSRTRRSGPAAPLSDVVQGELFPELPAVAPVRVGGVPVYAGTSGYYFADWGGGVFYPAGLPKTRMLDFYQEHFAALELNSTFYGPPRPEMMDRLARDTREGFRISVKAYRGITHEYEGDSAAARFAAGVEPLREAGRLAALVLQYPGAFHDTPEARRRVAIAAEAFVPVAPTAVEFRHRSWDRPGAAEWLRGLGVAWVSPDVPDLPELPAAHAELTGPIGYCRLHSRNAGNWYAGGQLRYDYWYSPEELQRWAGRVRTFADAGAQAVYVFFSNCIGGQAIDNVRTLRRLLEQPAAERS